MPDQLTGQQDRLTLRPLGADGGEEQEGDERCGGGRQAHDDSGENGKRGMARGVQSDMEVLERAHWNSPF